MMSMIETRNRHFLDAARRVMKTIPAGHSVDISYVARKAAASSAPHYYCTYAYALRVIRVLRHGRMAMRRDRRLEMFSEINDKCERLMAQQPGLKLTDALAFVLASERASQFFIAGSTAVKLVQQLRRESRGRFLADMSERRVGA